MSPQQTIAHYRITAKLGEGGMGEVWRATDTKLNRDVAIKILPEPFAQDPDRMARFEREAKVLASLNHPNIAAIHGVEDRALVMELVEGPTLAERIAAGPMPVEEALSIAKQIAEALEYAHERGVIHRDLKPANIKITAEGRVKVLDFGLATVLQSPERPAEAGPTISPTLTMRATQMGMIMGTAAYMSPEQARGQNVDKRADIWAFGVVLYEMLTGHDLFAGPTVSDTLAAVLKTEVDLAPVPAQLRPTVERCLRKDPRRRWRDIGDVRVALEEGTPVVQAMEASSLRLPWVLSAALALALACLIAVAAIHFREVPPEPTALRFQIPVPAGTSAGSQFLALSPDGRKLAFRGPDPSAKTSRPMLWVRSLDSLETRALTGTANTVNHCWSPDGRFLAFSDLGGALKKIDVSGGPALTLASGFPQIRGIYWDRGGTIYFGTAYGGGIYRVPEAGGDPVVVSKPDSARNEVSFLFPQILPDGRHFLYLGIQGTGADGAIFLTSLDGKEKKRLVAARHNFSYAPPAGPGKPGHLLFLQENTLMAQPLDPKIFEPTGSAFPLAEGVASARAGLAYFSSSENGAIAYLTGGPGGGTTQLRWFDRAGKPADTVSGRASYNNVALARDARRAAVVQTEPQTNNTDIWLIDLGRGIPTRFTFDDAWDWDPIWSPDDTLVAFSSNRGHGPFHLYVKDTSGVRPEEQLQKSDVAERPCDWSPDGRYLMYTRGLPSSGLSARLWVLSDPASDTAKRKAAPYFDSAFNTTQCQFSPDGHWVAYVSDESRRTHEVWVQSFPAGAGKFQVSSSGGVQPRWRRDGKELFYIASDGKLMAVDVKTAPAFQAEIPHALFDPQIQGGGSAQFVFRYDVAPDGQRFLVNTEGQAEAVAEPITVVLNWQAGLKK
ncbi:MAG TPA: protein kinase [Bryobacteraceae bacterium]|nr:protein kinase [Bryobacteraceae bacterium]